MTQSSPTYPAAGPTRLCLPLHPPARRFRPRSDDHYSPSCFQWRRPLRRRLRGSPGLNGDTSPSSIARSTSYPPTPESSPSQSTPSKLRFSGALAEFTVTSSNPNQGSLYGFVDVTRAGALSLMTTAPFVSPSLSRAYSARATPVPKFSSRSGVAFPARPYRPSLRLRSPVTMAATGVGGNGSALASQDSTVSSRLGEVKRVTKETNVHVKINLDGTGVADCSTGIPFLDHMLDQLASHGLFDVYVKATGDTHIDDHHSNEDIALAIGTALLQALGDRKGINRFGHFTAPLDEAAVEVILDLSGRPHLSCGLSIPTSRVGKYDTQLVEHFFQSLVNTSGMTLHIRQLAGNNSHHIIEAAFKAFARALRQATEYDLRRHGTIPSSKGVLSRS